MEDVLIVMSKKQTTPTPVAAIAVVPSQPQEIAHPVEDTNALFGRFINDPTKVVTVHFQKTLTKPLMSVSHRKEMMVGMLGEPYELEIPVAGRSEKAGAATVVDCLDFDTKSEITLVCNTMMVSAFKRDGKPLRGRVFHIEDRDIKADKRYRVVNVQEVELTLEDKK